MRTQLTLATILSLMALARMPAANRAVAQQPAENPRNEVLQRFVGVWDLKSTSKPARWNPHGGQTTGKESTVWALNNRIILIRDISSPDGGKGLYIATYDAEQQAYPFWCFNSDGLPGTQWLLKWNAEAGAAVGRSTDSPPAWTSGGQNRFPDANTNLVHVWMRNENGELLMESDGRKDRLPADREQAIVAAWKKHEPAADLPAELRLLDRMVGTWDTVSVQKPAEWTPAGGQSTGVVTREWILNGRFVMDTSRHSTGEESLAILGYDSGQRAFRSWWFNSLGHRNDSRGQWDQASQTLSFQADLEDGKTMRSSVRFANPNQEAWEFKATDAAGKVYFDMDITATRRKG